jgi:hypothetical protein
VANPSAGESVGQVTTWHPAERAHILSNRPRRRSVCGDEATKTTTVTKEMYKGIGDRWFREHFHDP